MTYKSIAVISHPLLLTKDGRRDVLLRSTDAPKTTTVPLYSNHDLSEHPIGFVELEHTTIATINGQNMVFVAGMISSQVPIKQNQAVSISAPLVREHGQNDILGEILEVSLVDVPSLDGCLCLENKDLIPFITGLYMNAPRIVDALKIELASL